MSEIISKRLQNLVVAAIVLMGAYGPGVLAAAPKPQAGTPQSAKRFVQAFYDWYVDRVVTTQEQYFKNKPVKPFDFADAIRARPGSFSRTLRRLLEEDRAASDRCEGFAVGIDWDPFLQSQDPSPTYTVSGVERLAAGYRVSLDFHNDKVAPEPNPVAQADVVFSNGRWVFVDFVHSPTNTKLREGLVHLLRGYERSGEYAPCPKSDRPKD